MKNNENLLSVYNFLKHNVLRIFFIFVLFTVGLFSVIMVKSAVKPVDYEAIKNQVYNISNEPAYTANTIFKDYAFYFPADYRKLASDDSLLFTSNNATFVLNFGHNETINQDFLEQKNAGAKKEFEYISTNDTGTQYFIVWDREDPKGSRVDYKDMLIGINDRFIEATIPVEQLEKYATDSAYILNSIKENTKGDSLK